MTPLADLYARTPSPARLGPAPLGPLLLSAGRAGLGGVMLAAPVPVARALGRLTVVAQHASWPTRVLGAREVPVGLGSVVGLRRHDRGVRRTWLLAGLACDLADLADLAIFGATLRPRTFRSSRQRGRGHQRGHGADRRPGRD